LIRQLTNLNLARDRPKVHPIKIHYFALLF
jgi:hypothetical protein